MNKMLLGALCLALSLNLKSETGHVIDLAPDFIGYLLLASGAKEVNHWSKHFRKIEKIGILFAVYALVTWGRDALNLMAGGFSTLSFIVDLLEMGVRMAVLLWVVQGIHAVELQTDFELRASVMKYIWIALAVLSVINTFVGFFPVVREISGFATMALAVCYMIAFFRSKCYYDDAMAELEENE